MSDDEFDDYIYSSLLMALMMQLEIILIRAL